MLGSDVKSGHLHNTSGYIYKARARVRAIDVSGSSSAGILEIWDTNVAPIAATYARSGTTVTVTKSSHGLPNGARIGISFYDAGGNIATPGNYDITVVDADTFTLEDINSGTISALSDCAYVYSIVDREPAAWRATYHTAASDIFFNGFLVPNNGLLCKIGIYCSITNMNAVTIYYN
jgi:hypothetical protein